LKYKVIEKGFMRHRVKKIKFKGGHDATRMIVRQLLKNFIQDGKLISSHYRIRALRSEVETLVHKAKRYTEADKNFLKNKLEDKQTIQILHEQIAPLFKERVGGYVRITKMLERSTDNTSMSKLEWVQPVVLDKKPIVQKKVKQTQSSEPKAVATKKTSVVKTKSKK